MARDEEILAAAEKLFYERGFDRVGVDEIGKALGISGSALYRHFPSKGAILAALFDKTLDSVIMRLGLPDDDPQADLEKVVRGFVGAAKSNERLVSVWVREQLSLSEQHRRKHDLRRRSITDRWVGCLNRLYPSCAPDDLITAMRGVQMLLLSESMRPPGGRGAPRAEELLVQLALSSLQALEPAQAAPLG